MADLNCPLCLSTMDGAVTTNCGHSFCAICFLQVYQRTHQCAVCRNRIFFATPAYNLRAIIEQNNQPRITEVRQRELDAALPSAEARQRNRRAFFNINTSWTRMFFGEPTPTGWNYKTISFTSWFVIFLSVLYFLSPFDIIPDHVIPGLSLVDDTIVFIWVYFFIQHIHEKYYTNNNDNDDNINININNNNNNNNNN